MYHMCANVNKKRNMVMFMSFNYNPYNLRYVYDFLKSTKLQRRISEFWRVKKKHDFNQL